MTTTAVAPMDGRAPLGNADSLHQLALTPLTLAGVRRGADPAAPARRPVAG